MKKYGTYIKLLLLAVVITFTGCETMDSILQTGTQTEDGNQPGLGLPAYYGVKHSIGVLPIEDDTDWFSEDISLTKNMTPMLENALKDSNRFIVVDRANLDATLAEQDLQTSGRAAKADDVAQTGFIRSAKYLASITILEIENKSGGGLGGASGNFGLGLAWSSTKVSIMVKIFDSTTSEIIASQKVDGYKKNTGISLIFNDGSTSAGVGGYNKTTVSEALYACTVDAVKFMVGEFEDFNIEGRVVTVLGDGRVVINLGQRQNTQPGMRFEVRELGETLTDPATGEVLERIQGAVTCVLEITSCKEKISYCTVVEGDIPNTGDLVVVPPSYTSPEYGQALPDVAPVGTGE